MDGLEATEIKYSRARSEVQTFRLDSEFYGKRYLEIVEILNSQTDRFITLDRYGLVASGSAFYPAIEHFYGRGDLPLLRVGDIRDWIDYESCIHIPEEVVERLPNLKFVSPGDIVLTKGGTIANAGLIHERAAASRDLIFINSSTLSSRDQIALYLYYSTRFAHLLLLRSGSQSVQPHLTLTLVRDIPILEMATSFKIKLAQLVEASRVIRNQSRDMLRLSTSLLLDKLGLLGWSPPPDNTSIKRFADFTRSGRLDAEHYETKYDKLLEIINQHAQYTRCIGEVQTYNERGSQPVYDPEGGLDVITSKRILEVSLDYENFESTRATNWDDQRSARVLRNDILTYTTGAKIGRTQPYLSDERALSSNHVNILRIEEENPIYVAFVMNSIVGRMQTDKHKSGSAQPELYPKDIAQFVIPFVEPAVQGEIIQGVLEALKLKRRSAQLLDIAKRTVEAAIEENEPVALDWMNTHLDELGIEL